ncbi:hypothetical protein [Natrarchaeobius oligotrophus]|uniref:Uncharacterized protein n=1 Tax=Natrarchaeobius chitinivorans TaxID=1679083 RepID=A0A3N6MSC1_NATCH|nr:hypothetical protein [Natrarchaeobius chitinivorans]RQH00711.1 hypothetical protein EA472_08670 [Natrarchaeobius chitinivorans]
MSWTARVDQLLYDGEAVERRVECGAATLVVTTHRVLAFTPRGSGPAFRTIDRPNVRTVAVRTVAARRHLIRAVVTGAVGIGALAVSRLFRFADLVPDAGFENGDGATGDDGSPVGGALETIEATLALVDLAVVLVGAFALALAAVFAALYVRSRSRRLVIEVDGDDDVELPVSRVDDVGGVAIELDEAIRPEPSADSLASDERSSDDPFDDPGLQREGGDRLEPGREADEFRGPSDPSPDVDGSRLESNPADSRLDSDRDESG